MWSKDDNGDEKDGMDETLVPLDYQQAGQIRDDLIFDTLVKPLPEGANLTVVMDCCHSGSILDLPFFINGDDGTLQKIESGEIGATVPNPNFTARMLKLGMELARMKMGGESNANIAKHLMANSKDLFSAFGGMK